MKPPDYDIAMTDSVDFQGLFETLPDAIAVCDEDGNVIAINRAARQYLAVDDVSGVRIELQTRETVRQIRLTNVSSAEFFLADVGVHGAGRSRASASFHPLGSGSYRVVFAAGPDGRPVSPNIRMLESLVNVGRHLELFKTPDKTLALFAASFVDLFPIYSFRIDLGGGRAVHEHRGWDGAVAGAPGAAEFVFSGAARSWDAPVGDIGRLVVERQDESKFSVSDRQAFETFAQQLGLALARVYTPEGSSDSMLVGPIIDQLDAIVIVCDARRRILVANRTFEAIVGTSEIAARDLLDYFHEPERPALRMAAAGVMASGEPCVVDVHLRTAANGRVALRVQLAPAGARDGGDGAGGFVVTGQQGELSLVELEERMNRAEQLMNLGELATGVAHELKNPLTSILNYAEYLRAKYTSADPAAVARAGFDERDAERLERIIAGVGQIDEFVKDLVTLARPNDGQVAQVNLHSVVHESVMMCEVALAQANTTVRLELTGVAPIVPGFRNQLKQVFVNLVTNAGKSMSEEGGTIVLGTEVVADTVVCRVVDDGAGMSEETLKRIFEPFFTTRQTRGGSGLGLALVRTIVQRHGGDVAVESRLGHGTTFKITLPTVAE